MIAPRAKLACIILLLICTFAWGCSSSDGPTQVQQTRISDVGKFVTVHEYDDGMVLEYEYQGIPFWGDMLLAEYEQALAVAEPRFAENEVLLRVTNTRVVPPSQHWGTQPDEGFILKTCTAESVSACDRGSLYMFDMTVDGFGMLPVHDWLLVSN